MSPISRSPFLAWRGKGPGGRSLWPVLAACAVACARAPSPLTPQKHGSIGLPHKGTLSDGAALPPSGLGFARLRADGRNHGTRGLVATIERAAAHVASERPGSVLVVGDLSAPHGGRVMPHLSHRSGRDADLVLYAMTPEGAEVTAPGFIHYGPDGLAWDAPRRRYLRFDVAREWLLVKALVEDDDARVQWIFVNRALRPLLLEWAHARGEPSATLRRAEQVLLEPTPGGAHDDHVHIRVACDEDEVAGGCEPSGPERPWTALDAPPAAPLSLDEIARGFDTPVGAPLEGSFPGTMGAR